MRSFENCSGRTVYAVPSVVRERSRNVVTIRSKRIANDIDVKRVDNRMKYISSLDTKACPPKWQKPAEKGVDDGCEASVGVAPWQATSRRC